MVALEIMKYGSICLLMLEMRICPHGLDMMWGKKEVNDYSRVFSSSSKVNGSAVLITLDKFHAYVLPSNWKEEKAGFGCLKIGW